MVISHSSYSAYARSPDRGLTLASKRGMMFNFRCTRNMRLGQATNTSDVRGKETMKC